MKKLLILMLAGTIMMSCSDSKDKYDFSRRISNKTSVKNPTTIEKCLWERGELKVSGKCNIGDVLLFIDPKHSNDIFDSYECSDGHYKYKKAITRPPCELVVEYTVGEIRSKVAGTEKFCQFYISYSE